VPAYTVTDIRESIARHPPYGEHQNFLLGALENSGRVYFSDGTTGKTRPTVNVGWDVEMYGVITARALWLTVQVESHRHAGEFNAISAEIAVQLKTHLGVRINVEVVPVGALDPLTSGGAKKKRFEDRRPQSPADPGIYISKSSI
jgi:phenylacetate-coenzyme A ligase PaaK-like adenylate-forming protein